MTQIKGYIAPTRRQGQLGIHSLDHFSMVVPDLQQAQTFYALFGLDVRREGQTIGLYTPGRPHRWGIIGEPPRKKLHYLSFGAFVGSVQDVGAMQMAERGFTAGWGMGRHVLGSNYFHYVRDPWGSHSEYSADMDYIPVTQDWQDADQAPEDAFYLWGPNPPEDFTRNYEVV